MEKIKYLVMDVDGTLTDGLIYMGNDGEVFKVFHIKDGYGIHELLPKNGIIPVIITGRASKILEYRCKELGIRKLYQGIRDKTKLLDRILTETGYSYENVAYIGDDCNDVPCMQRVHDHCGIVGCPADAVEEVKQLADYICSKDGGEGAVREYIEWLIR